MPINVSQNSFYKIGQDGSKVPIPCFQGEKGQKGQRGQSGQDGRTPIKGQDYFTQQDKTQFVDAVKSELQPSLTQVSNKIVNQGNTISALDRDALKGSVDLTKGEEIPKGGGSSGTGGLDIDPNKWPDWTSDEQAVARDRIKSVSDGQLTLISETTIQENGVTTIDMMKLKYSVVLITVQTGSIAGSGSVYIQINAQPCGYGGASSLAANKYSVFKADLRGGTFDTYMINATQYGYGQSNTYARPYFTQNALDRQIHRIQIISTTEFPIGTVIKVYAW